MKYLLTVLIVSVLAACQSDKKKDVIGLSEAYLKDQMKDPSSFQVIESKIVDTTMMRQYLLSEYSADTSMANVSGSTERAEVYRESAKRWLKKLNDLKQDSIYYITVKFEYRAKNGFGALDKYTKGVKFFPADSSYRIIE